MTELVTVTQRVDTVVKVLRRKPLKRFSTKELSEATGISPTVLTSNMKVWMTRNLGDMIHVFLEPHQGHAYYFYDPDNERTEAPPSSRKTYRRKSVSVAHVGKVVSVVGNDVAINGKRVNGHEHTLAKIVFDEGGMVVAVTQDGEVIKGRYLS